MTDPFWLGVLVTLAIEGAVFAVMVLTFLAWIVVAIKLG